jgi:ABC-type nitrate/sulfonate/bicarbonate transport system permease component
MWNPHEPLDAGENRGLAATAIIGVLGLWSLVSGLGVVSPARLPAPWDVAAGLAHLAWNANHHTSPLLLAIGWSLYRVGLAMAAVCALGIPVGILMGSSPKINAFLSPIIDPLRSAPIVAVLPILMMWLGIGEVMKIAFLWLGAVVYLVPMVRDAIRAVPQDYVTLSYDIGATPLETVWHTIIPLARPRIFDAIIVSVGIEWTYITVAEYVNADQGLGYIIQTARKLSAMDQVFGGILVILVLALVIDKLLRLIKGWAFPWEAEA